MDNTIGALPVMSQYFGSIDTYFSIFYGNIHFFSINRFHLLPVGEIP